MGDDREDNIRLGATLRGARLNEQYGYHAGLIQKELAGLQKNGWHAARNDAFNDWHKKLAENVGVHEAAKDARPASGKEANATLQKAKEYKLKTTNMAANIFADDPTAFDGFSTGATIGKSPRLMINWLDKVTPLIKSNIEAFKTEGAPDDWHDVGTALRNELSSDKAAHQLDIASLPKATADVYEDRAKAYKLLKILNRCGRNLHVGDRESAQTYNLDLLNAHGSNPKKTDK